MRAERVRPGRWLAAGLLAGASLAVTVPPTHAGDETTTDIIKDVREVDIPFGTNAVIKRRDRARDVVWSKAAYANDKFTLQMEVRNLAAEGYAFLWQLKDATHRWTVEYNHEATVAFITITDTNTGFPVPCEGTSGDPLPAQERVKVVVPASCFGDPDWVKYGSAAAHLAGPSRIRIDDGRRAHDFSLTKFLLGDRIHEN